MYNFINFDSAEYKTVQAVKNGARLAALEFVKGLLESAAGVEEVSVVGSGTLAFHVGDKTCADGQVGEVCVEIDFTAKDFDVRTTSSGKTFEPYERLIEAENYEEEVKEKKKKEAKKKADSEKKKAADKAAREKLKAEKEARKAQKNAQTEETAVPPDEGED